MRPGEVTLVSVLGPRAAAVAAGVLAIRGGRQCDGEEVIAGESR